MPDSFHINILLSAKSEIMSYFLIRCQMISHISFMMEVKKGSATAVITSVAVRAFHISSQTV
jgi:hypothetical protein